MIVAVHVALGGVAGALAKSRGEAVLLGALTHLVADVCPHEDIDARPFEIASGVLAVAALASRYGSLDPVTIGAAAASAPDLEHVLPTPRPGGKRLFPSHRWQLKSRSARVPVKIQLIAASLLLAGLLFRHSEQPQSPPV